MLAASKESTYGMFRPHFWYCHDCRDAAVDHKLKFNRIMWRQRIGHPTTYGHGICLQNFSAYCRIEILEPSYTQYEANEQYFQQRFEQHSSNKTGNSFRSWFFDHFSV